MMSLLYSFGPLGLLLQALAIIHFIRRRPDTYWLYIIIFLGPLGALVYLVVEALPDIGLLRATFKAFPRRKRIHQLEAMILDNPSPANLEELADLYFEDGKFARAREYFDRSISKRTDSLDPFYRRALCALEMGDFAAALPDLERVVAKDPRYDYHRARGLLAHACASTGQTEKAAALFADVTRISTLSETQYNYACFLAAQGHPAEARDWVQRVLAKKPTMPSYLRRRERPWFRKAAALLKQLPGVAGSS